MKEKRNQRSLKRNWKRNCKTISAITIITFIVAIIFTIAKADAAYAGNYNDIGTYNDSVGGKSINGVRISKNSEILNYALDMWEKNSNNEWQYTGSNIDGYVSDIESSANNPVFIKGKSEPRFGININSIKNRLPQNGSIVVKKYKRGKTIYKSVEYTYQTENENEVEDSVSLLKQVAKGTSKLELSSTDYAFDGVSYVYDIYDAAVIGQSGDIYTSLDDCRIISEGYAYYGVEGEYLVRELPVVEHNEMDGYTYSFDGWYGQDGYKIHVGDAIDLKTTIYPRWDITHISYNVNYIDILGDQPSGTVLGTSTATVYCNDEVNGSDIGSDESVGAYYTGLYYTGCTSAVVQGDCDVYRYFRPALYNIVFNGNMNTSGETAPLYNCIYGEAYKLTENGFKRNGTVTLDLNAEDATCATKNVNVVYEFKGWSETVDGGTIYTDCESVSNVCESDGEKQLYAVWDGGSVEISAIPEREGYRFDGWSKEQSATSGNTWFDVSDGNECTLYAIWIKKQEETDNNDNGDSGNNEETDSGNAGSEDSGNTSGENAGNENNGNSSNISSGNGDNGNSGNISNGNGDNGNGDNISSGNGNNENGNNVISGGGENTDNRDENNEDSSSTDSDMGDNESGDNSSTDDGNNGSESNGNDGSSSNSTNSTGNGNNSASSENSGSTNNSNVGTGNSSTNSGDKGNSANTGTSTNTGTSGNVTSGSGISNGNTTGNTSNGNQSTVNSGSTTSNSSNNSSTNVNNDSTTSDSNMVTQNPNIDTNNKKGNNKDEASKDNAIYPKVGKKYTKSGIIYKIIKSNSKKRTVKVIKATKNITKAKIPGNIKIKGYKYKVVSIAKKAFIKCSQLKKAVIGKNIKSIGKKAFYKNKALGNITIKSLKLKSIGKSAFKHIKSKCSVKIAGSKKYSKKVFAMMNA